MSIKLIPLFISLAVLSGNALAQLPEALNSLKIDLSSPELLVPAHDSVNLNLALHNSQVEPSSDLTGVSARELSEKRDKPFTGFYVGGFVGGAAGTKTNTTEPVTSGGILGFYPGDNYNYRTKASVMGGGTVGYNWRRGESPYVVGL
nr:hypothetical protein [Nitrosomonadaceae bacterium]